MSEPDSTQINEYLTFKLYSLFKMFFENGNTKQLGSEFEEKVFLKVILLSSKTKKLCPPKEAEQISQLYILSQPLLSFPYSGGRGSGSMDKSLF